MTVFGLFFLVVTAGAVLGLPRRWATLPLMMGACYTSPTETFLVGPFHFSILRILLLLAICRAIACKERIPGGFHRMDRLMIAWGILLVTTSVFHNPMPEMLVYRLGVVYDAFGMYFVFRLFCQCDEDLVQLIKVTGLLLVPIALEMLNEKRTGQNLFGILNGLPTGVEMRDGKYRANGPFAHSILAGTVGALCLPLMAGIWHKHRRAAWIGIVASVTMVITSKSSGPIMTLATGLLGLCLWRWRHLTGHMRIGCVVAYILLDIVMKEPAYFIMAKIDLTGASTGWYRSELIRQGIQHFNEWWFSGTDYTRHWMPTGLTIDDRSADIVNFYLAQGVNGGILLMAITIGLYSTGFRYVGAALRLRAGDPFADQFLIWAIGSGLFAHTVTSFSVSYFDQSVMFFYVSLAATTALYMQTVEAVRRAERLTHSLEPDCGRPEDEPNSKELHPRSVQLSVW